MSAQAYLDNIESKTGLTPRQFIALAHERDLTSSDRKAGEIIAWLKGEYGLGHGHAMAMAQVIKQRETVDAQSVDPTAEPPARIGRLWLDGKESRPW